MSKSISESFAELDAAANDLRRELSAVIEGLVLALLALPGVRRLGRRLAAFDARYPWALGWVDRLPRWTRFGTPEFIRVLVVLYLSVGALVIVRLVWG